MDGWIMGEGSKELYLRNEGSRKRGGGMQSYKDRKEEDGWIEGMVDAIACASIVVYYQE